MNIDISIDYEYRHQYRLCIDISIDYEYRHQYRL